MFKNVSNVRITKTENKIRIQAYRGKGKALHMGPEINLNPNDPNETILELIQAITELQINKS